MGKVLLSWGSVDDSDPSQVDGPLFFRKGPCLI